MTPSMEEAYLTASIANKIQAAEEWADPYKKQPDILGKLIRTEAKFEVDVMKYLRELSSDTYRFVNWGQYSSQVKAAQVDVIVNDDGVDEFNDLFIKTTFDEVLFATSLGATFGENEYSIPLGIDSADAALQKVAKTQIAELVGKKLDKEGIIIDNPRPGYSINETTRANIRQSISTSLSLGEDIKEAQFRLTKTIKSPSRALLIAQTETVNAFQRGLDEFGRQSGAVGKVSQSNGAVDYCAAYAALGPVVFDYLYGGKYAGPAYHPRCRCGKRLIYQIEVDRNPGLLKTG